MNRSDDASVAILGQNLRNSIQSTGGLSAITEPRAQLCGIERFMVRTTEAICTHFFSAIEPLCS